MLLDASPILGGAAAPDIVRADILAVTPEMSAFIDQYVEPGQYASYKLKRLLYALLGEGEFELVYDDSTRTAASTFENRRGNCISFTNMFIAMARDLGLEARYQEVEIPPPALLLLLGGRETGRLIKSGLLPPSALVYFSRGPTGTMMCA